MAAMASDEMNKNVGVRRLTPTYVLKMLVAATSVTYAGLIFVSIFGSSVKTVGELWLG
jgi:hypothetical protein